ncbi:MAG: hypothetical protein AAB257_08655, partial [Nitrospinota bacterium]
QASQHCGSILTELSQKETAMNTNVKNIFSIAAVVLGGISIIFPVIISWLTAITGIVMGAIALVRKENKKLSYIGLFLSIVALLLVLKSCADVGKELSRF